MENVEYTIQAQEEDIMSGDIFDLLESVDHKELRQDGQSLEPNTEGPCKI